MNATRTLIFMAAGILVLPDLVPVPATAADEPVFLRGDVNADGRISISDALMFRRYYFHGDPVPSCLDAADADDNGTIDLFDVIGIINRVIFGGSDLAAPFPEAGVDPTPDDGFECLSYRVEPALASEDVIRIGKVRARPGEEVEIPVYLKNSVEVEALQMIIEYDPSVFKLLWPSYRALDFTGTPWEKAFDWGQNGPDPDAPGGSDNPVWSARKYPSENLLIVGVIPHFRDLVFEIPPGPEEKLIFKIRGTISADARPGTSSILKPTNGPDDQGVQPPLYFRNEITYRGEARYASLVPRTQPGMVNIVDEITAFIRGDSNGDRAVDIADVGFLLDFQFLGGTAPRCLDAADADDSGTIELTDAIVILDQLFIGGGTAISAPYPLEGEDATADDLAPCF